MTAAVAKGQATLEEFERLPVGPPNFEFEAGEIIAMSSPTPEHQDIVGELFHATRHFVRSHNLGRVFMEVDVYLPDGRVYIPDISFLPTPNLHCVNPINRKIYGVPNLCVEVISQDEARDRVTKFRVYYANGVVWYWLIDPATLAVEEYHWTPDGYVRTASVEAGETFHPGLFPGMEVNLTALLGLAPPSSTNDTSSGQSGINEA